MLTTHSAAIAQHARHLATQARDAAPHYQHSEVGYNYRLSNLLAAVGRGQLRSLPEKIARRAAINAAYRSQLGGLPGIAFMPDAPYGRSNSWLTCVTVRREEFGGTREDIRTALEESGIESRPLWKPMHRQPVFAACPCRGGTVADDLFARGLCLPSGSSLTTEDQESVTGIIRRVHASARGERGIAHA